MLRMSEKMIKNVLIVEDDRVFCTLHRHLVKQFLELEPEIFTGAENALDYLDSETWENELSLVLLDLNMPGMNGWDFLDELSKKDYYKNITVIIVTSSPFREDYERSINYDRVLDYLTKPLKKKDFQDLLDRQNIKYNTRAFVNTKI